MSSFKRKTINLGKTLLNASAIGFSFLTKPLFDFHFSSRRCKGLDLKQVRKIAVFHFDGSKIGDAINSTAVIEPLRKHFPDASISVMYNKITKDVVKDNPLVDKVFIAKYFNFKNFLNLLRFRELRKENFDLVVSMSDQLTSNFLAFLIGAKFSVGWNRNFKGSPLVFPLPYVPEEKRNKHETEYYCDFLRAIGLKVDRPLPRIFYSAEAMDEVSSLLSTCKIKKSDFLVGIHAGAVAFYATKMWPWQNFAKLADWLIEKYDAKIIFIGQGIFEEELNGRIIRNIKKSKNCFNFAGKTNLEQLIALIRRFNLFICNDSGPLHIAAAQGIPLVTFFGPTDPRRWGPKTENSLVLYKNLPCSPCDITVSFPNIVNCHYHKCMKLISIDEAKEGTSVLISKIK